ncbi:MAG: hypothetical protein ACREA0_26335 [bacterium]
MDDVVVELGSCLEVSFESGKVVRVWAGRNRNPEKTCNYFARYDELVTVIDSGHGPGLVSGDAPTGAGVHGVLTHHATTRMPREVASRLDYPPEVDVAEAIEPAEPQR